MKSRLTLELGKIVYDVLKRKIKTIGAEEFTCKGYPNELKEEIVSVVAKCFKEYARKLIPEELKEIYNYYLTTRRVGHTYSMIEGAKNTDCLVVCVSEQQRKIIDKQLSKYGKTITLTNIGLKLQGTIKPMLIDHYALCYLIKELLRRIEEV